MPECGSPDSSDRNSNNFLGLPTALLLAALLFFAGYLPASAAQSAQAAPPAAAPAAAPQNAPAAAPASTATLRRGAIHPVRHGVRGRVLHHRAVRRVAVRRHSLRRVRYAIPDPTLGDVTRFDDPMVRKAAIAALGHYYGSVVAVDPNTGRILSIVNQQLAYSAGFEPCSTIKPVIALAALKQGLITDDTMVRVARYESLDLTEALAHSNNEFFAALGERLGFSVVSYYAHQLGLGERAGWDLPEEQPGTFPDAPPPADRGGIGKMTSFGESIRITPLQLAAMMSVFANGGSLYYLQYPQTEQQVQDFTPRLKRKIEVAPYAQQIREGMLGAVEFGTARESFTPDGEMVYAKTGTCTDETQGGELGWFVSYATPGISQNHPQIVLVVLLRRYGYRVSGPHAAEIGGVIYRQLYQQNFFAENHAPEEASAIR